MSLSLELRSGEQFLFVHGSHSPTRAPGISDTQGRLIGGMVNHAFHTPPSRTNTVFSLETHVN
jgi:hypothetical protein